VEGLEYKTEEELQKSIKLEPDNLQTRLLLANLFTSQGEYGKAQKEYDEILNMDPSNIEARYYLAGVLANQNRIDDALLAYQKILDVNPKPQGFTTTWVSFIPVPIRWKKPKKPLKRP
jgi:Tfp pilus assembly protein PilF